MSNNDIENDYPLPDQPDDLGNLPISIEDDVNKAAIPPTYGCEHYKCRCAYVSPCCNKEYTCRLCHDDKENHEINRHKVMEIICLICSTKQPIQSTCVKCNTVFGNYFCEICRLFDDNDKQQYHCDLCGICRIGGRDNFFHCLKCDMCLSNLLKDSHKCVEKVTRSNCPVCLEDLHTSRQMLNVLSCGHICHKECISGMFKSGNFACPLCCQSMFDMSSTWDQLDTEISSVPMPDEYKDVKCWILCRDCHKEDEIAFHIFGLKCINCGSYNTCRSKNPKVEENKVE